MIFLFSYFFQYLITFKIILNNHSILILIKNIVRIFFTIKFKVKKLINCIFQYFKMLNLFLLIK